MREPKGQGRRGWSIDVEGANGRGRKQEERFRRKNAVLTWEHCCRGQLVIIFAGQVLSSSHILDMRHFSGPALDAMTFDPRHPYSTSLLRNRYLGSD